MYKKVKRIGNSTGITFTQEERKIHSLNPEDIINIPEPIQHIKQKKKQR